MTRIIIEVPDSFGPLDLDGQILQPCKNGGVVPIFIDVMPGDRVSIRCVPAPVKNGISVHKDI